MQSPSAHTERPRANPSAEAAALLIAIWNLVAQGRFGRADGPLGRPALTIP